VRRKYFLVILFLILAIFLSSCGIVTPPITDKVVYRALLIGIGDYIGSGNNLLSPTYSVNRMHKILNQCRFGLPDIEFSIINELKDSEATKSAILDGIASTFSGAENDDMSYFYFTGHGYGWPGTSYLCPADFTSVYLLSSLISVDELENALSAIPGTKVVILDTCYSGGFIGKSREELRSFNDGVISVFSQGQSKNLLATNRYKVLTSCHDYQECYGTQPVVGEPPLGVFTKALCEGCGYNYNYPADTNEDTKVSLQEAYIYVKNWVQYCFGDLQDVQVYPGDSSYPIVEY